MSVDYFTDNIWLTALVSVVLVSLLTVLVVTSSPRAIAAKYTEAMARSTSGLVRFLTKILGGLPARLVTDREENLDDDDDTSDLEEQYFREYVSRANQADVIDDSEAEIIQSVFDMSDTRVRAVMVPRIDVIWLETGTSITEATELFIRSGNSRIPLIGDNPDDVLGIVYLKDIIRATRTGSLAEGDPVDMLARPVRFVPESKTVWALLEELQRESTHMCIVVDEYGGTAGLVTLEDLIEEMVGDISDEYDNDDPAEVVPVSTTEFLVSAKMSVSDFADAFKLHLEEDLDVDTVGGLLAKTLGKIPIEGSETTIDDVHMKVESLQGRRNRVHTIRVWTVDVQAGEELAHNLQEH